MLLYILIVKKNGDDIGKNIYLCCEIQQNFTSIKFKRYSNCITVSVFPI